MSDSEGDEDMNFYSDAENGSTRSPSVSMTDVTTGTEKAGYEPFPLMRIPLEILLIILRFLSFQDRMQVRGVNRALHQLEANSMFEIGSMYIRRGSGLEEDAIQMNLIDGPRDRYIDGLQKLATNVIFSSLIFDCNDSDRVLIPYVKSIRSDFVILHIDRTTGEEEFTDEKLDSWISDRKDVNIFSVEYVSLSGLTLYRLFTDMEGGRTSLVSFYLDSPSPAACRDLLLRVGITYVAGRFQSSRRDVEIFLFGETADDDDAEDEHTNLMEPTRHFIITIGMKMVICIRKWIVLTQHRVGNCDLIIETLEEDGVIDNFDNFEFVERKNEEFERLPITYSD